MLSPLNVFQVARAFRESGQAASAAQNENRGELAGPLGCVAEIITPCFWVRLIEIDTDWIEIDTDGVDRVLKGHKKKPSDWGVRGLKFSGCIASTIC